MTRLAAGSPEMWRDIARANAGNLSRELGRFIEELQRLQPILADEDNGELSAFLETAKQRRDGWCAQRASPSSE